MKQINLLFWIVVTLTALPVLIPFHLAAEESVEEVEDVEVVDVQDGAASQGLSFAQFVGRNHAAAVHLPIGFLFALCLVELIRIGSKKPSLEGCGWVLSIAAVLSFVPAAITGLLRAAELFDGKETPHLFLEHRNLMIIALVVLVAALGLRIAKKNMLIGKFQVLYLTLLTAALVLTATGAHHGGMLVYGEHFLPY